MVLIALGRALAVSTALAVAGLCYVSWSRVAISDKVDRAATRILFGQQVQDADVRSLIQSGSAFLHGESCNVALRSAGATLRLHLASQPDNGDGSVSDLPVHAAALRQALACNPSNGFLWSSLAWIEALADQREKSNAALRLSYLTTPYDAWVVTRRNRIFVGGLDMLPGDLASTVLAEYRFMVRHGLLGEALTTLATTGWAHHEMLIASVRTLDQWSLMPFRRALENRTGLTFEIPGHPSGEARPWR